MGFPFWLRNWCEKEISWYAKYIDCRLHASGTGDYLLSNDLIMFSFESLVWRMKPSKKKRSDSCKLVNGTMIFNGNFIANWNSSESGQISLILYDLFWYAPNYILHRLSDCFISLEQEQAQVHCSGFLEKKRTVIEIKKI